VAIFEVVDRANRSSAFGHPPVSSIDSINEAHV
jgi:hypothetical protein